MMKTKAQRELRYNTKFMPLEEKINEAMKILFKKHKVKVHLPNNWEYASRKKLCGWLGHVLDLLKQNDINRKEKKG